MTLDPIRRPTIRAQELRNNAADAERHLWRFLRARQLGGHKFSRQMPVGPFICDFMCRDRALVVELDGGQHNLRQDQDASRTRFIEAAGFHVLRFWNNDVLANTAGVLEEIAHTLDLRPPLTPPACERGTRAETPLPRGDNADEAPLPHAGGVGGGPSQSPIPIPDDHP